MEFNPMFDNHSEERNDSFSGDLSAQQSGNPVSKQENSVEEENLILKWMIETPNPSAATSESISDETDASLAISNESEISAETNEVNMPSFQWNVSSSSETFHTTTTDFVVEEEPVAESDDTFEELAFEEPVFESVDSYSDESSMEEPVFESVESFNAESTEEKMDEASDSLFTFESEQSEIVSSVDDVIINVTKPEDVLISSVTADEELVVENNFSELSSESITADTSEIAAGVQTTVEQTDMSWMNNIESSSDEAEQPLAETELVSSESDLPWNLHHNNTQNTNHTQPEEAMKFDLPEQSSIIKVIGVGGGGSNAVNHMYQMGIRGVDFIVCNTDKQALDMSPVPHKITLGVTLTEGRGAGSIPDVGRNAAIENIEDIRSLLANNTKMVFITAGMGGGTGTGAAPVIAGIAREMGILTVAIVTIPFGFEGKKRRQQAEDGLEQLKQSVDTMLVIQNDKLREMYGNLKLSDAFGHADDVLSTAAKSIAEIISLTQQINVDFADVCTVMRNSGVAIMGSATASGENRAVRAVESSLNSPLLNDNNITGARFVLLNIVSGAEEITMDELGEITDYIQEAAGQTAEIIKGYGVDPSLGDSVSVTIIATGFNSSNPVAYEYSKTPQAEKVVLQLDENKAETLANPVVAKTEIKTEERNVLEPFLVNKSEEAPVVQSVIEFEITNVSPVVEETKAEEESIEPFLISKEEFVAETTTELVESKVEEPVLKQEEIVASVSEPVLVVAPQVNNEELAKQAAVEEQAKKAQERISKLKEISLKLKTTQGLSELENEPAYKRRQVELENTPHSSESQVSRFTLTETEDKKIEIRPNNSFLHDNVD